MGCRFPTTPWTKTSKNRRASTTEDNGDLHIRSDFLVPDDDEPHTVRVAFIMNLAKDDRRSSGVLFSIHDEDIPVFRLLRMRARRAPRPDRGRQGSATQAL